MSSRFEQLAPIVAQRLAQNERLRRTLPGRGRLRFDRQLPFLCVYRRPARGGDPGTEHLVTTEAAYLFSSGQARFHAGLRQLAQQIVQTLQEHFGVFLFLEIWSSENQNSVDARTSRPGFQIHTPHAGELPSVVDVLRTALGQVQLGGRTAEVEIHETDQFAPPGLPPLMDDCSGGLGGCCWLGLEVRPVYRSADGTIFPMVLQSLRRQLAPALRKAVFAFSGNDPEPQSAGYQTLGPTSLVKSARLVDQRLSEVSRSFDFILQVTPVNTDSAWQAFVEADYQQPPTLHYRPLPYHPSLLKRKLFDIPIERIEDTALAQLLWEKQEELDRQLTALRDLDTPRFLPGSLQLYERPDADLVELAEAILSATAASQQRGNERDAGRKPVAAITADQLMHAAREEIDYYHQRLPSFAATVESSAEIAAGIMVAQNRLLISQRIRIPKKRMLPLLHHEVGTHLLTYYNGREQPFQQLSAGLAGYEPLQEGLAVLAEYLTGGLTRSRLRQLAARVIAVEAMVGGASFMETFRALHDQHGFGGRMAFHIAVRVYRGGGLTKDAVYLAGLRDLLAYLSQGHDLEPLYVGKIALVHVPLVQDLRRRGIIVPPALLPRFWQETPAIRQRLEQCRKFSVLELLTAERPGASIASGSSTNGKQADVE